MERSSIRAAGAAVGVPLTVNYYGKIIKIPLYYHIKIKIYSYMNCALKRG